MLRSLDNRIDELLTFARINANSCLDRKESGEELQRFKEKLGDFVEQYESEFNVKLMDEIKVFKEMNHKDWEGIFETYGKFTEFIFRFEKLPEGKNKLAKEQHVMQKIKMFLCGVIISLIKTYGMDKHTDKVVGSKPNERDYPNDIKDISKKDFFEKNYSYIYFLATLDNVPSILENPKNGMDMLSKDYNEYMKKVQKSGRIR